MNHHLRFLEGFRWEGVDVRAYKTDASGFRGISRQVLFDGSENLNSEIRYFEILAQGFSSLEKHRHEHAVIVIRGSGRALVGENILTLKPFDVVLVPGMTWHQFRADSHDPLGFICTVDCHRDQPKKPTKKELDQLRQSVEIAQFIRT